MQLPAMQRTAGRVAAFRTHRTLRPAQPVQGMLALFLAAALLEEGWDAGRALRAQRFVILRNSLTVKFAGGLTFRILLAFATGKATESLSTNPSSRREKPPCRAIGSPLPHYGRSINLSNG